MSATARPTSWPYFRTVSPDLMSRRAILWPRGTGSSDLSVMVSSVPITQPVRSFPGCTSSTTTTPTVSALSWTIKEVAIPSLLMYCEIRTLRSLLCGSLRWGVGQQTNDFRCRTGDFVAHYFFRLFSIVSLDGRYHCAQALNALQGATGRTVGVRQAQRPPAPDAGMQRGDHGRQRLAACALEQHVVEAILRSQQHLGISGFVGSGGDG